MFRFFPKEEKFFDMFERACSNLHTAGQALKDLLTDFTNVEEKAKHIKDLEHEGDIITHEIYNKLNRTFITPIDREDIHKIAKEIDDILDFILGTVDRLALYRVAAPTPETKKLADVLLSAIDELGRALPGLKDLKHSTRTLDYCIEINRLENDGDTIHKAVIADLFSDGKDAIEIIKWRDIYNHLETAIDRCEDVANTIESIVVKNA